MVTNFSEKIELHKLDVYIHVAVKPLTERIMVKLK